MIISVCTLFPELYDSFLKTSLIGRAQADGRIQCKVRTLFEFCAPKERIDGPTFGPGAGVVIRPEVIERAVAEQEAQFGSAFKIFFSPQGKKLDQHLLKDIYNKITAQGVNPHVMLFASRYEGMDARIEQEYADALISVGDFVLMGGDLPAMTFLEGLLRFVPGVVGKVESVQQDSFTGPFVDYPEYTAPLEWKGHEVPEVIRSGNHKKIAAWREQHAAQVTISTHFDWLRSHQATSDQERLVESLLPHHYAALMHNEVLLADGQEGRTSVTSLDMHDIARSAKTYGLKKYGIITDLDDQQKIVKQLLDFWQTGEGIAYNPQRHAAVSEVVTMARLDDFIAQITEWEGKEPVLIATSARPSENMVKISYHDQSNVWALKRPVLFIFGTGHGLAPRIMERCDFILPPLRGFSSFNHLSVRSAAAVVFDRWLGINLK